MAQNFLGALRAQSEGQGNLSMHPQGDNLYGYGPTTHFLAYFRLVLGATNTPPAPRFRPVLGLAAPAAPFGSFGTFRDLGSPEPQNVPRHVLGLLADRPPRRPTFRPRGTVGLARCRAAPASANVRAPHPPPGLYGTKSGLPALWRRLSRPPMADNGPRGGARSGCARHDLAAGPGLGPRRLPRGAARDAQLRASGGSGLRWPPRAPPNLLRSQWSRSGL